MTNDNRDLEFERDIRKERIFERLGTRTPCCTHCGEDRPETLERHHIAGRKFDDETAIFCRNCHRCLSFLQQDHPKQQKEPVHRLECIGHYLLGIADFFEMIIKRFREFARILIDLAVECQQAGIGGAK